jgi:hypothetical protein
VTDSHKAYYFRTRNNYASAKITRMRTTYKRDEGAHILHFINMSTELKGYTANGK